MVKKNHVLFIVENNSIPSDIRVWTEAKAVKQFGFDVSIISPVSRISPMRYEKLEGIEIYRHPLVPAKKGKTSYFPEYLNALLWEFVLSVKIFLKKPFHIIHGANPPDLIFMVAVIYKIFGCRYIFDHHDISPELFLAKFSGGKSVIYRLLLLFEKLSCRFADVIISTNESYKKIVVNRNSVKPEKVFVVRNDPPRAGIKNEKIITAKKKQFVNLLYVGSITSILHIKE